MSTPAGILNEDQARRDFTGRAQRLANEGAGAWWATPAERAEWATVARECARLTDDQPLRLVRAVDARIPDFEVARISVRALFDGDPDAARRSAYRRLLSAYEVAIATPGLGTDALASLRRQSAAVGRCAS